VGSLLGQRSSAFLCFPCHHVMGRPYAADREGKLKLSLCLTKHHATKTYWGSGGDASQYGS
jgi:hypothetical protein